MTLTTRLTLFSLVALAVVLAGFSTAVYFLARYHLFHQVEGRLDTALNVLTAATEIKPDGVEWEPGERRLSFGPGGAGDEVAWLVSTADGQVVDRGTSAAAADFLDEAAGHLQSTGRTVKRFDWQGGRWLARQQRVEGTGPSAPAVVERNGERLYPALIITVGIPLGPVQSSLRELSFSLAGLSLVVLVTALLVGRAVCRWALRPVARMAREAHEMDAGVLDRRLPAPSTGDELEELGQAFNGLLARVQEAFERQRGFTAEASHQLRTPLTALLGQVEVALRRERPPEEYRRVLAAAQQQGDRLRRIVDGLLFLARADAEAGLPERERLDLRQWVGGHVGANWSRHPRASDIVTKPDGERPAWVNVHPVLLGELVNVLLDNACKYSPAGSPITIRVESSSRGVELTVEDQGCGIGEHDRERLFKPFVRSETARRRGVEGFGLGLAVAKRIADAHQGTLTVASQVGQGSRITLLLAMADPPERGVASEPPRAAYQPAEG